VKRFTVIAVAISLVLIASACSSDDASSVSDFNDADVTFAQGMIVHHEQAIEMARLAPSRAASADVKDLARRIEAAQDPEITQMTGWLKDWGKPVSAKGSDGGMADHESGATEPENGMMSEAEMGQLTDATGSEFDKMFLEMMTGHHRGAVEMSTSELADGENADAKKLAQTIIDTQTKEISEMEGLLARV